MKLVVFLGNPGREYQNTKHNIAWMALEKLSFFSQLKWREKFKGEYALYSSSEGTEFVLLKPTTYMNLSGRSVSACLAFYKIEINSLMVVHDDMDVTWGGIIFKQGGGLAGHNGLKSIAADIGTQNFQRIRIGIGRPSYQGSASNWVLSGFSDKNELEEILKLSAVAVENYIQQGFSEAAKQFSRKNIIKKQEDL